MLSFIPPPLTFLFLSLQKCPWAVEGQREFNWLFFEPATKLWKEKCCKMYRCLFLLQSIYTFPKTVIMKRPNFFTVAKPQTSVTKLKSSPKRCYHPVKLQILLPFWFHTETSKYSNTTQTSENYCNQWHYKANSSYPKLFWFGLTSIDVHVVYTVQPISFSEAFSSNCSNILFYWKHFNK